MDTPKIIKADSSNVEEVKSAITLGFAADPLLRWFFPDPHKFLKNFAFWMDAFSKPALESDSIFTDENYYGGAIWHPPGIHLDPEVLGPTLEDIPSNRLESALQMFDEFDDCHPKEDHWYLPFIGLDPSKQGQGIGSLILKESLKQADEQGKIAYLESSNPMNMSLYERHGFETIKMIEIGDSPPAHPMIRYPR